MQKVVAMLQIYRHWGRPLRNICDCARANRRRRQRALLVTGAQLSALSKFVAIRFADVNAIIALGMWARWVLGVDRQARAFLSSGAHLSEFRNHVAILVGGLNTMISLSVRAARIYA